ncbi:ABC transporter ATP-binding protein [Staphylococcus simiae]|uniref:ABC transporter ATP-binding protein n=1 Tax=Staphylococcus simiae TaxID=308354 RepID=UPI001A971722|nr:ABC transporter ATP-binding protein [Staphylococcus simiae]MBO1199943.1 ABC transporter ATP-binding protein [Staphylococcus simiae]MBO1202204.1 ABC transporter ATP-binding protein [Staphylococcus simiae]MBO1204462.1 ABC transporter ATP-binding protein [Staphylococcus simiae]MBO1212002.1 ABC transporter ATP-binding protein [Staphylococcus simiae]MBO1230648.1 ABC transporter ATP-binding protein [Staphylococcus simiae]
MITINNLTKTFNNNDVVKDLNFNIEQGQCTALIGKNGAGKSTLIDLLIGNIKTSKGDITDYENLLISANRGVMYQYSSFPKSVKVKELFHLYQSFYNETMTYNKFVELTKFDDQILNQYAINLSGGQQRILDFVLTLVGLPQLLILDEPTSGMDIESREHFWSIIKRLKQQNKTIFYTSHYIEEVERMADKVIFLDHGHIHFYDSPQTIKEHHQSLIKIPSSYNLKLNHSDLYQLTRDNTNRLIITTSHVDKVLSILKSAQVNLNDIEITKTSLLEALFHENNNDVSDQSCY